MLLYTALSALRPWMCSAIAIIYSTSGSATVDVPGECYHLQHFRPCGFGCAKRMLSFTAFLALRPWMCSAIAIIYNTFCPATVNVPSECYYIQHFQRCGRGCVRLASIYNTFLPCDRGCAKRMLLFTTPAANVFGAVSASTSIHTTCGQRVWCLRGLLKRLIFQYMVTHTRDSGVGR